MNLFEMGSIDDSLDNIGYSGLISTQLLSGMSVNVGMCITPSEAALISKRINIENQVNGHHMLDKSMDELFTSSFNGRSIVFRDNSDICGFVTLTPLEYSGIIIYERGSLIVSDTHRNRGLGFLLVSALMEANKDKPVYSVTNVPSVMSINRKLNMMRFSRNELSPEILKCIESKGALLENDLVYMNDVLFNMMKNQC